MVERLTLDVEWVQIYIPHLEHYFDEFVLPEIVYPKNKPPYIL